MLGQCYHAHRHKHHAEDRDYGAEHDLDFASLVSGEGIGIEIEMSLPGYISQIMRLNVWWEDEYTVTTKSPTVGSPPIIPRPVLSTSILEASWFNESSSPC